MLLLFDFVKLVLGTDKESIFDFLASRPVSRSKDPSLGLFERLPGGASLEVLGPLEPDMGIFDILGAFESWSFWSSLVPWSLGLEVKDGANIFKNFLSGDDRRSSKVIHCIQYYTFIINLKICRIL